MKSIIKIKDTSKSGVLAQINGVYGQLKDSIFIPYTEEHLAKKTAYKESYGWEEYASIEEFFQKKQQANEARKVDNEQRAERNAIIRNEENTRLAGIIAAGPIPATVDNIRLLALWLNEQNWGAWTLPAMTIGYSAHQYDCDGSMATTIELKTPIMFEDWTGEVKPITKFKVGGKRGHLEKYTTLR